jgi:uncharacterized repeat protein (TIGR03803 family)
LDGAESTGALIEGPDGMLYGTTSIGGTAGDGTVFQIAPDRSTTLLYDFHDLSVGADPEAGLYRDAKGNLFGTTFFGGVFEIPADGSGAKALHVFSSGDPAGFRPKSQLVGDADGNLYGTTSQGGSHKAGAAFKLKPDGTIEVLHVFGQPRGDGKAPVAGMILDADGNLYGTTPGGGAYNAGTVYRIGGDGSYAILHDFGPVDEGMEPVGGLARDRQGNLYGTTIAGGDGGAGTVFRLAPDGTLTVLHSFTGQSGDGGVVESSPVLDSHGNVIVAAAAGGGYWGCGTVVEVRKDGTSKVLHHFTTKGRHIYAGCYPYGGVMLGSDGAIYGTTLLGGWRAADDGTVYRLEH